MNKLPNNVIYNIAYTLLLLIQVYENINLYSTEIFFTHGYIIRKFDSMFLHMNNMCLLFIFLPI